MCSLWLQVPRTRFLVQGSKVQGRLSGPKHPFGGWSDSGPLFPGTYCKHILVQSVWEPGRVFGRIDRIGTVGRKCNTAGSSDPRFFTPEVRMTVVRLHQLPQILRDHQQSSCVLDPPAAKHARWRADWGDLKPRAADQRKVIRPTLFGAKSTCLMMA